MDGINKVTLLGNVGGDPRSRTFDGGGEVANLTLATTKKGYTKRDGTQVPERTEWHNITASGSLAGVVRQYVHKGDRLYVEGELRTREYEKDGIKRYVTEVWMTDLRLLRTRRRAAFLTTTLLFSFYKSIVFCRSPPVVRLAGFFLSSALAD